MKNNEARPNLMIIDDDDSLRHLLKTMLGSDFMIFEGKSKAKAQEIIERNEIDVALLDIRLGIESGVDVLAMVKELSPDTEAIMITVVQDLRTAIDTIKLGAFDYIDKNFNYDDLHLLVGKALEKRNLKEEVRSLRGEISELTKINYVAGTNRRMQEINQVIERIAGMPSNVLIEGESGTGKEVVARRIHNLAQAQNETHQPFVGVNVSSIPSDLLESTLFGHEKGAFTGATKRHKGKFEMANGGTLFLDEIGDLKQELQVKILRAIQEREIERVGGETPIKVNLRLIAATNKDLKTEVKEGRFREDLYYRLNVIPINLPPLRERIEDLPDFMDLFIKKYCSKLGKAHLTMELDTLSAMSQYDWPGNIRELENLIERMIALSTGNKLTLDDLPMELRFSADQNISRNYDDVLKEATQAFERQYILRALAKFKWNQTQTASSLGIHRKTLEYKIKALDLGTVIEAKRKLKAAR